MAPPGLSVVQFGVVTFLGVVAFGVGAGLLYDAVGRIRFQRRARGFERVDATVVDAAVHEPVTGGREAVPHVEYEYEVDGERYVSRRVWPTRSATPGEVSHDVARRVVEDHPVDAEVIARYDPEDPGTAYLLEEFDRTGERVEFVLGALLLAVSAGIAAVLVGLLGG